MTTRCFMPPENWWGYSPARSGWIPTFLSISRASMAAFARENGVPFLDLGAETAAPNTAAGPLRTTTWYRQLPDGSQDNAHLQSAGALRFARAFVGALHKNTDPRLDLLRAVCPLSGRFSLWQ